MEKPANKLFEGTQKAHDEVPNFSLELLRDKLEYFDVKANFYENQTSIINMIICKVELKGKELSEEEQELTDKLAERAEVKKNLVNILKGLKSQRKVKKHKKENEAFIRRNGFIHCPECSFKTKWNRNKLKLHINVVHRKLKPWKCSDCTKDFATKSHLSLHKLNTHNTNKSWICDCCGSRFGTKTVIKIHMLNHLPPSFSCSECGKKFMHVGHFNAHKKLHQGILNKICKFCNKGYATKNGLNNHIIHNHFAKFHCEVTECSSILSSKSKYKRHLKTVHKKNYQVLIENLLINLEKLKPNFQQLKYV